METANRPQEVDAFDLAMDLVYNVYESSFGGQERGPFIISRRDMKELINKKRIKDGDIDNISEACLTFGLVMIDMDDYYAFIEEPEVCTWRPYQIGGGDEQNEQAAE
jgi:hypothetical protein